MIKSGGGILLFVFAHAAWNVLKRGRVFPLIISLEARRRVSVKEGNWFK